MAIRFKDFGVSLDPWRHQEQCYLAIKDWLSSVEPTGQCNLPTGTGKSLIQRSASYLAIKSGQRVVLAVSNQEILGQFATAFCTESNIRPSMARSNRDTYNRKSVLNLVTQQFLWQREIRDQIARDSLLIWDESHHANEASGTSYHDLAAQFNRALFFSATNWNQSAVRGPVLYRYGLAQAWSDGILAKPEMVQVLSIEQVPSIIEKRNAKRGICYHARGVTIEHARSILGGESVFGERDGIEKHIRVFQAKRLDVLHAVGRLREGFDPSGLQWVCLPWTKGTSIGEMQRIGRLLRKDATPKVCIYNRINESSIQKAMELAE